MQLMLVQSQVLKFYLLIEDRSTSFHSPLLFFFLLFFSPFFTLSHLSDGEDYMLTTQLLTFNSAVIEQTVTVPIIDDTFFEFQERFFGDLTRISVANVILDPDEATVLINDNDGMLKVYLVSVYSYQLHALPKGKIQKKIFYLQ